VKLSHQQQPNTLNIEVLDVAPAGGEIVARVRVDGLAIGVRMRRSRRAPAFVELIDDDLRDRIVDEIRSRIGGAA
jgi:hypothetical protein